MAVAVRGNMERIEQLIGSIKQILRSLFRRGTDRLRVLRREVSSAVLTDQLSAEILNANQKGSPADRAILIIKRNPWHVRAPVPGNAAERLPGRVA